MVATGVIGIPMRTRHSMYSLYNALFYNQYRSTAPVLGAQFCASPLLIADIDSCKNINVIAVD